MSATHKLYQEAIIKHNQNTKNVRTINQATHQSAGYNPLCGDHIHLQCCVSNQKTFEDIAFEADSCAVVKASASMLSEHFKKLSIDQFNQQYKEFKNLLHQADQCEKNQLGDFNVFKGIWDYPSRIKCATLPWETLKAALRHQEKTTTE